MVAMSSLSVRLDKLLAPLWVGLFLRLLYLLLAPQRPPVSDDAFYWGTAQMLATGAGYTMDGVTAATEFMPGLPLLLSVIVYVFGPNLLAARLLLIGFSVATIPLVENAASYWFNGRLGRLSAWAFALFPPLWFYSSALLSETPAIFVTALLLDRAARLHREFTWRSSFYAGLCYLALLYLKPELVMLGPLYVFVAFVRRGALPRRAALTMSVIGVLSILPWTYRNWVVFEEFIPLKTTGGKLLYWASLHPPATEETNLTYQAALKQFYVEGKPGQTANNFSREGMRRIKDNPLPYLIETVTVRARMLFIGSQCEATVVLSRSFSDLLGNREWALLAIKTLILLLQSMVSVLGILGLLLGADPQKRRSIVRWHFLANTLVYVTLLGITRYSMVLMPMLIPHAVFAIATLWSRYRSLNSAPKSPAAPCA
jgi:4-amino-4-deoxy-L-arabinose transferase-like glycosyltransferase